MYADNTSDVSDAVWMSEYRIDCDPPDSTYSQFNALLVGFFLVWGGDGFEINEDAINGKSETNKQTNKLTNRQLLMRIFSSLSNDIQLYSVLTEL